MKTSLRILGILLLGLFAISTVGCERKEDPPPTPITPVEPPAPPSHEEKLAGEYELTRAETKFDDGTIVGFEPPLAQGSLILVNGGSYYLEFSIEGSGERNNRGDKWSATATTITFGESVSYTLQGTTLTLTEERDDGLVLIMHWKKKA